MKRFKELRNELISEAEFDPYGLNAKSVLTDDGVHRLENPGNIAKINAFIENFLEGDCMNSKAKLEQLRIRLNHVGIDFDINEGLTEDDITSYPVHYYGKVYGYHPETNEIGEYDNATAKFGRPLIFSVRKSGEGVYTLEGKLHFVGDEGMEEEDELYGESLELRLNIDNDDELFESKIVPALESADDEERAYRGLVYAVRSAAKKYEMDVNEGVIEEVVESILNDLISEMEEEEEVEEAIKYDSAGDSTGTVTGKGKRNRGPGGEVMVKYKGSETYRDGATLPIKARDMGRLLRTARSRGTTPYDSRNLRNPRLTRDHVEHDTNEAIKYDIPSSNFTGKVSGKGKRNRGSNAEVDVRYTQKRDPDDKHDPKSYTHPIKTKVLAKHLKAARKGKDSETIVRNVRLRKDHVEHDTNEAVKPALRAGIDFKYKVASPEEKAARRKEQDRLAQMRGTPDTSAAGRAAQRMIDARKKQEESFELEGDDLQELKMPEKGKSGAYKSKLIRKAVLAGSKRAADAYHRNVLDGNADGRAERSDQRRKRARGPVTTFLDKLAAARAKKKAQNRTGKIGAGPRKRNESVETLEALSSDTLRSYVHKASGQVRSDLSTGKHSPKTNKRAQGVSAALSRLDARKQLRGAPKGSQRHSEWGKLAREEPKKKD